MNSTRREALTRTATVTVIGESAFEGSSIRSIDLPDTIQLIRKRAFANCSSLTNMN